MTASHDHGSAGDADPTPDAGAPDVGIRRGARTGRDAAQAPAVGLPGADADEWGEGESMRDDGARGERAEPVEPGESADALSESQVRIRRTLDAAVSRETESEELPRQRDEVEYAGRGEVEYVGREVHTDEAISSHAPTGWRPAEESAFAPETSVAGPAVGRASVVSAYQDPGRPGSARVTDDESPAGGYQEEHSDAVSRETPVVDDEPPLAMEARRAISILNPSGEARLPRPLKRRLFCIANQKGGVGKTTTAVNLAVALALHGSRVLVVDLDPQGNASTGLGVEHRAGTPSVYESLLGEIDLAEAAQPVEGIPNLACAPATIDLAGAEVELVSMVARESRLTRAIDSLGPEFDYVFVDCPPSLGLLTVNALVATEEVLIPIQCEYYALEGLGQLLRNIELVKAHLNPRLRVSTILLTMYDRRTKLADQVEQEVRSHFGDVVLETVIPRSVRVSEAPGYGQSVMTYDPGSRGATSYFGAAQEIAAHGAKAGES